MANKSRYFIIAAHIENMKKSGLSDEQIHDPKYIAKFFLDIWKNSGDLVGESTTETAVAKAMFESHVEICKRGSS